MTQKAEAQTNPSEETSVEKVAAQPCLQKADKRRCSGVVDRKNVVLCLACVYSPTHPLDPAVARPYHV